MRARIIPQDAGPQNLPTLVQQRRAMHVARNADAAQVPKLGMVGTQPGRDLVQGGNPVRRILLGPARMRMLHGIVGLGTANRLACRIHQKRAQPGGAQIYA